MKLRNMHSYTMGSRISHELCTVFHAYSARSYFQGVKYRLFGIYIRRTGLSTTSNANCWLGLDGWVK